MEFKNWLREKYYEYLEEQECYKEPPSTYEEYIEKNLHYLKEMYDVEEGKK